MKAISHLIAIAILSIASIAHGNDSPNFTSGINIGEIGDEAELLHELISSNKRIFINPDGIIFYEEKDHEFVKKNKRNKSKPSLEFTQKKYATMFIALLEMHKIKYTTKYYCAIDRIVIYYDKKDEDKISKDIKPQLIKAMDNGIKIHM